MSRLLVVRKYFIVGVALAAWCGATWALTDPAVKNPGLDLYLEKEGLVWTAPTRFKPKNLGLAPRDISYWKKVLPYEEDRYADVYMVIPQLGLITPIQHIPPESADGSRMLDGHEIGINKYLKNGIIEYAGSVQPGHLGKRIDFGHSNYYTSDEGRYKTIFATLMWLDPGDEVWYFVRSGDVYGLYRYEVTASYPTKPSNVAPLLRDGDGADALIFGCYHGLDGRWMVEATYIGTPVRSSAIETQDQFADLPAYEKSRIDTGMIALSRLPTKRRKQYIAFFYSRINRRKTTHSLSIEEQTIIDYIIYRFAELY